MSWREHGVADKLGVAMSRGESLTARHQSPRHVVGPDLTHVTRTRDRVGCPAMAQATLESRVGSRRPQHLRNTRLCSPPA